MKATRNVILWVLLLLQIVLFLTTFYYWYVTEFALHDATEFVYYDIPYEKLTFEQKQIQAQEYTLYHIWAENSMRFKYGMALFFIMTLMLIYVIYYTRTLDRRNR